MDYVPVLLVYFAGMAVLLGFGYLVGYVLHLDRFEPKKIYPRRS